jgi:hypothetical protein
VVLSGRAALLGAAALAAAAGCGNGLSPGNTADAPEMVIYAAGPTASQLPAGSNPLVGIIWTDPLQRGPDVTMPGRWVTSDLRATTDFGSTFVIRIFRPPPAGAVVTIDSPAAIADPTSPSADRIDLAVGELVVVDDVDGDGAFAVSGPHAELAAPDRYLAVSQQTVVYVARPFALSQPQFPLGVLMPGYQALDYQCTGQVSRGPISTLGAIFQVVVSNSLPETRICDRTHSP